MSDSTVLHEPIASRQQRFYYMDNLRAFAMMLGIFFHAALAYSPLMHNLWFVSDPNKSLILDFIVYLSHLFRMPLFFLISGFFAIMLIERRGLSGFLKNRAKRVLLPFIVFYPLVLVAIIVTISWGASHVNDLPPILALMAENPEQKPQSSTAHLWFLFNLFGFCLVLASLTKLRLLTQSVFNTIASLPFLLVVFPLLIVPALFSQMAPFPAPERLYPELWSYGFYGFYFLVGAAIYTKQNVLDQLVRFKWEILLLGLGCYVVYYQLLPEMISLETIAAVLASGEVVRGDLKEHIVVVLLQSFGSVYMVLSLLLFGRNLFNSASKKMRYFADSSYWLYIVHIPLLLVIQFPLIDLDMNIWLKFSFSFFGTLTIGYLTYWYAVRFSFVGKFLNGKKHLKSRNNSKEVVNATR